MSSVATNFGIVAIGRNEGDRLRQCLVAARAVAPAAPIVYVDSGSTDGSADLARSFDAQVVDLDLSIPFTAARARNEGLARLLEVAPQTEFVQFIDGDCALQPGWLDAASAFLQSNPKAAAACGRRRERFPEASVYNKLADMEWDTPVGSVKSCGGDVLMRITALHQVGGYNNDVIAGEEPELCVRLRAAGWSIHRLDHEMTLHDAAMTRFGQWWKRNVRAGHAYAEGNARHGAPPERFRAKEVRSNWTWGLFAPIGTLLATIAMGVVLPRWSFIPPVLLLAGYVMLVSRVSRYRRSRGDAPADARRYALFTVLGKLPQSLGQLKYHRNHRAGRRSTIIEYKSAAG